jgi:serine/threonine protein kinase
MKLSDEQLDKSTEDLAKSALTKTKCVGNYEIIKTIGEGAFAKVKLATHRLTNQKVISIESL